MKLFQKLINLVKKFGINANKIELSANDILNLLAGNTINLSSKNIVISSTNFNVDKNGKMTCSNATITGGKIKLIDTTGIGDEFQIIDVNDNNSKTMIGSSFFRMTPNIVDTSHTNQISMSTGTETGEADIIVNGLNYQRTTIKGSGIETPTLTQTSLKSKKKNIKKLDVNAIELIKNSDICLYNLKGEKAKSKKHIGLVIGDGYNCPIEVISQNGQGIEQYSMTSLAWKAVQEEDEKVEMQNKLILQMQKEIENLKKQVQELKEAK